MKHILFFMLICLNCKGQCFDIYGSSASCPTKNDSLVVYNNAIKVIDYYDNNKSYQKITSEDIITDNQKREIFDELSQARRLFNIIRRELKSIKEDEKKFMVGKISSGYKDITYNQYYQEVDDNRFYQRELENQIVNIKAPFPIYDNRISPILINSYKNIDATDVCFGDLVNIPLYVPVIVKPFSLLTDSEIVIRSKMLKIPLVRSAIKRDDLKLVVVEKDLLGYSLPVNYLPVYYNLDYGAGCLIGFLVNRKFRKILKTEYVKFAVPNYGRNLLENEIDLDKYLSIKYGKYYLGLY